MATTEMPTRFTHPQIGDIKGRTTDGVVQFLGLQYASLRDRFAPAELMKYDPELEIDATEIGPTTITHASGLDIEQSLIQATLPKPKNFRMSDTEGLNLNISLPEELTMTARTSTKLLPTFVFVHGGGFHSGANSYPQWDTRRLVKRSVEGGLPVIAVGINYRLGATGFLTSAELRAAGYQTNNGLRDQVLALQWVKKYIGGFGGDSETVTFVGQSAGAVSGHFHLASNTPLFKRMASFGGTQLLIPPVSLSAAEGTYKSTAQALGLYDYSAEDRVKALVEMPAADLLYKLGTAISLVPVVDGDIICEAATFEHPTVGGSNWCRELFIGDCAMEGLIFAVLLGPRATSPDLAKRFVESASHTLTLFKNSHSAIARFLNAYDLDPTVDTETALFRILKFFTEINFQAPSVALARRFASKGDGWDSYIWRFNEPNPWPGKWKGYATHILDLAYVFMNFEEVMTPSQQRVGQAFADDLIKFVNGIPPWKSLRDAGTETARVYGPSGDGIIAKIVPEVVGSEVGRADTVYRLSEGEGGIPLDHVAIVFGYFLSAS